MGPKHILIIGNYGAGNLGDDAILAGILEDLKAISYSGKIEVMHGGFDSSSDIYKGIKKAPFVPAGLRSRFKRKSKKAAYAAIKRADLAILGGGGLFVDTESVKAPMIWAAQAKACQRMKTPYVCYGQSVGPLKRWLSRHITKQVFKNAKAVHVRDEQSFDLLEKFGIKNLHLGTDPSFSWLQKQKKKEQQKKVLAISIRNWDKKTKKAWEPLLAEVKNFAKKKKLKPILITMDRRDQKELQALKATGIEIFEPASASLALKGFLRAKMAITMRLHAGIFALFVGKPLVAISYSSKVAALMKTLKPKGGFQMIEIERVGKRNLKKALNVVYKKGRVSFDLESPIMQNQAFLAHALDLH